jgi:hypothetical protein
VIADFSLASIDDIKRWSPSSKHEKQKLKDLLI